MSVTVSYRVRRGGTFFADIVLRHSGNNDPVDLNGYVANAEMIPIYKNSNSTIIDCSVEGNNGTISLSIDANTTESIVLTRHTWELKLTAPTGVVSFPIQGYIDIDA